MDAPQFSSVLNGLNYPLETLVPSGDGDDEGRALLDPRIAPLLEFGDDVEEWTVAAELSAEYLWRVCRIL